MVTMRHKQYAQNLSSNTDKLCNFCRVYIMFDCTFFTGTLNFTLIVFCKHFLEWKFYLSY